MDSKSRLQRITDLMEKGELQDTEMYTIVKKKLSNFDKSVIK